MNEFAQVDIETDDENDDCIALVNDRETDQVEIIFRRNPGLDPVFTITSKPLAKLIWKSTDWFLETDDIDDETEAEVNRIVRGELQRLGFIGGAR